MAINRRKAGIDWLTLGAFFSLLVIGWLMLYAVMYVPESESWINWDSAIGNQTIWLVISILAFFLVQLFDDKLWSSLSYFIYAGSILLLLLVLVLGTEIRGARSWFVLGGFSFQPSEIAKFGTCLALSSFLGFYKVNISRTKHLLAAAGIILLPILLILLQPDAGSAVVFMSLFIVLFRAGASPVYYAIIGFLFFIFIGSLMYSFEGISLLALLIGVSLLLFMRYVPVRAALISVVTAVICFAIYMQGYKYYAMLAAVLPIVAFGAMHLLDRDMSKFYVVAVPTVMAIAISFASSYTFNNILKPHQQERINVWLRPDKCDPHGSLYNIIQSKLAIGSGGFQGKGFLNGEMTKLNYVPQQSTDFIFSTIGEEQGFIGSLVVIALFIFLIIRVTMIAERGKNKFITYYAYGVASILFVHFFINIGMAMGVMPVIGIPLPFISKGGSSLLGFCVMMGVLIKMDQARLNRA